jgi:hypothetical protein
MADPTRCIHLCCKSMVVFGENFKDDPEFQAGLTPLWCVRTAKGAGPDGEHVALELCSDNQRECYEGY